MTLKNSAQTASEPDNTAAISQVLTGEGISLTHTYIHTHTEIHNCMFKSRRKKWNTQEKV